MMALHKQLGIDLEKMNDMLCEVVQSDGDLPRPSMVYDHVYSLIAAGGKRLRPLMVIVGGRFGSQQRDDEVWRLACSMEYIHMASLVHDDVIDQSELRRGEPTLHSVTDTRTAILLGNYMISRALEWATRGHENEDDQTTISVDLAGLITELCIGEYDQLQHRFNFGLTKEQYLDKTRRKTALLMASSLSAGALAAGADRKTANQLFEFGEAVGMSFQIQDDIADFMSSQEKSGKPIGADLRSGNVTLPVLYAMRDPQIAKAIRALNKQSEDAEFEAVIQAIKRSGAIEQSAVLARTYTLRAKRRIASLQFHQASADLKVLIDYFLKA